MKNTHTPGPWHVVENEQGAISIMPEMLRRKNKHPNDSGSYGFETGTGHAVAFVDGWTNDQANAALIAAAPDLLAALEIFENLCSNGAYPGTDDLIQARAAIAKARGES